MVNREKAVPKSGFAFKKDGLPFCLFVLGSLSNKGFMLSGGSCFSFDFPLEEEEGLGGRVEDCSSFVLNTFVALSLAGSPFKGSVVWLEEGVEESSKASLPSREDLSLDSVCFGGGFGFCKMTTGTLGDTEDN